MEGASATWTNSIGEPELIAVRRDPDFDPALKTFHYASVIEIPTPRWTAYEAERFGIDMVEARHSGLMRCTSGASAFH